MQTLVKVYGFESAIEAALTRTPRVERLRLFHRPRSRLIAQDLLALGLAPAQLAQLPRCDEVPGFRDVSEALGWLYVVERSALLHLKTCSRLVLQLSEVEGAFSYLLHHDCSIGARWSAFGRTLDYIAAGELSAPRIVNAAIDAFECQRRWVRGTPRAVQARSA